MVIRPQPRRPFERSLGSALGITAASAVVPGTGHLLLGRRAGMFIVGAVALLLSAIVTFLVLVPQSRLVEYLLTPNVLRVLIITCIVVAIAWVAVIVQTYRLARPSRMSNGQRTLGVAVVVALCLGVVTPFGYAANLTNTQRNLLDALFPTGADSSIGKPRINVLLVGSDAGPDRIGTRTDTLVVANIDTRTGRTVLFGLPRNIGLAQFPPDTPMGEEFPDGFHDPSNPESADFLLNAVYAYGHEHPRVAPAGPSTDGGLNLLYSSVGYMLGLDLDYYIKVNMEGFASIIDALGGLDVDVGPNPIPMGGIGPTGESVRPFGYIPPGRQHLNGDHALWYARSRTNTSDYTRMGRQRCLLQYLVDQKSPSDVLRNFQSVAVATTNNVATNIPQGVLPALVTLAGKAKEHPLESVSFDPNLPDPNEPSGKFNTTHPDFRYMKQVVRNVLDPGSADVSSPTSAPRSAPRSAPPRAQPTAAPEISTAPTTQPPGAGSATATSLADACRAPEAEGPLATAPQPTVAPQRTSAPQPTRAPQRTRTATPTTESQPAG